MAQEAFHNFGSLQLHENALVGFHTNLTNDGPFYNNRGLVGFYGADALEFSGVITPVFNDLEIVAEKGLNLSNTMRVANNVNFILGNLSTQKNASSIGINFMDSAFFVGVGNASHINGYASVTNKELFTFPVGDGARLRSLTLASTAVNELAKCAYFNENPNNPTLLDEQFGTALKESEELQISEVEFWKLESNLPSVVTFRWEPESLASLLSDDAQNLTVVGWSKTSNQWENLGKSAITGDLESGSITSEIFIPDNYAVLALGGYRDPLETLSTTSNNYIITPNHDGINDFLKIEGLENNPNNILNIYNRYGILVYSKINYANEFDGISNQNMVINRNAGLSSGVYFYFLTLKDKQEKMQGYVYIAR
ncbi:T9SS type B sorting domain-containing protein [Muricauda sp. JGD-17]|uniref:T9SS type B sorting domain-containing protein n=2 Tax=Flagellimonas ochracea TaxID=2696472 RepID=A0A964WY55_9FLAO|nr:T9SS type B sorting domain-containing protein [Allomuricauda ochracea]